MSLPSDAEAGFIEGSDRGIAATHVLGGLSWVVRSALYSYVVHGVSVAAIVMALAAFGCAVLRRPVCAGTAR